MDMKTSFLEAALIVPVGRRLAMGPKDPEYYRHWTALAGDHGPKRGWHAGGDDG
jgi:hypothetical protein